MLQAKFQDHSTIGSGEEIFKGFYNIVHGVQLGHVTKNIRSALQ